MVVSFQAFRDRFPDARITSDVVMVHNDQFVVKVTIETTAGSSTGLAASPSLETAEDAARQRALATFALNSNAAPADKTQLFTPSPALGTTASSAQEAVAMAPELLTTAPTDLADSDQAPKPPPAEEVSSPSPSPARPTPIAKAKLQKVASHSAKAATAADSEAVLIEEREEPAASNTEPDVMSGLPAPINLSDVIAQTDIELRRLGWSVEAGREYLETTYNKRSRHELSEEELIQFLCHLESLTA